MSFPPFLTFEILGNDMSFRSSDAVVCRSKLCIKASVFHRESLKIEGKEKQTSLGYEEEESGSGEINLIAIADFPSLSSR